MMLLVFEGVLSRAGLGVGFWVDRVVGGCT